MDENAFYEKYNFDNLKMVTVLNPTTEDYIFSITMETSVDISNGQMKSESKQYRINAGSKDRIPGVAANLYLDGMAKKIAQEEDRFSLYPDFAERAKYYDDLIIEVDDMFGGSSTIRQFEEIKEIPIVEEKAFETPEEVKVERPETARERAKSTTAETSPRPAATTSQKK